MTSLTRTTSLISCCRISVETIARKTALAKIVNDLQLSVDSGGVLILVLLDLTGAFDTVDHATLICHLAKWGWNL